MHDLPSIESALRAAFPARLVAGLITAHECEECAAIRDRLALSVWTEVDNGFAEQFSGSLPLLSADAYNAYLPVWLSAAMHDPNGNAAAMVLINLADEPPLEAFTRGQAQAILAVAAFLTANTYWGADDPASVERFRAVERVWASRAAA